MVIEQKCHAEYMSEVLLTFITLIPYICCVCVGYTIANNDSLKFYGNAFDFRGLSVL